MTSEYLPKFSPLPGGFQTGAIVGPSKLADIFTMPAGSNSAWIQADADIQFHMDDNPAITVGLVLPAKTFLALTNITEINQLVLIGTATISIQFATGDIGPIPPPPLVRTTGGGGGGSGTVTSLNVSGGDTGLGTTGGPITTSGTIVLTGRARVDTDKTLHVMKNGNDATGQRGRLDLPFLTVTAALAAYQPGDIVWVWAGDYAEGDLEVGSCNLVLFGANLIAPSSAANLFVMNVPGGTLDIRGTGKLMRLDGGDSSPLIYTAQTDCTLYLEVTELNNANGPLVVDDSGGSSTGSMLSCKVPVMTCLGNAGETAIRGWTYLSLEGNLYTGGCDMAISRDPGQSASIRGAIQSDNGGMIIVGNGDRTVMYGDITAINEALHCSGISSIELYGTIRSSNGSALVVNDETNIAIHGDLFGTSEATVLVQNKHGTVNIYGDVFSANKHAIHVLAGPLYVYGNCATDGATLDANAVLCSDGMVYVHGNCRSVSGATVKTQDVGRIEVFGNCYTVSRWAAYCITGGHVIVHGECKSDGLEGAFVEVGEITLGGQVIGGAGRAAVLFLTDEHAAGNRLWLLGSCRLVGNGTVSIAIQAGGITGATSYGAYANLPVQSPLAVAGTLNILP